MDERLQKILSQWGIASRRQAEQMILEGRVKLNSSVAQLGQKADPNLDRIEVDHKLVNPATRPELFYILLNKPLGVVSTCSDEWDRPTVLDLLPPEYHGKGIHPVGRLDAESTGALLLTNDGDLTFYLTHPRHHIPKTYEVWVAGRPSALTLKTWRYGVNLEGQKTRPAEVRILEPQPNQTLLEIVLKEGRNRQIRRVASQLGHPVIQLHRTKIGPIHLQVPGQPLLRSGHYRPLESFEIGFLKTQIDLLSESVPANVKEHSV